MNGCDQLQADWESWCYRLIRPSRSLMVSDIECPPTGFDVRERVEEDLRELDRLREKFCQRVDEVKLTESGGLLTIHIHAPGDESSITRAVRFAYLQDEVKVGSGERIPPSYEQFWATHRNPSTEEQRNSACSLRVNVPPRTGPHFGVWLHLPNGTRRMWSFTGVGPDLVSAVREAAQKAGDECAWFDGKEE